MKNKFKAIILGLLASTSCFSQAPEVNLANSLVWEVTGPNIEKPSYLVGTMHFMCGKDFRIDQRFHEAIDQSSQLFLEFDYDDPNELKVLQQSMYVKEPLKERLTSVQYAQLEEILNKHTSLKIKLFEHTSILTIQSAILINSLKCPDKKMMDFELMTLAQSNSMPVRGLETVEYQLEIMNKAFRLTDKVMTEEELEVFYNIGPMFDLLVRTYWSEDIDTMKQLFDDQMSTLENSEEASRLMLDVRNQNWAKKIPSIADEQATVFAFGAGHLAGEQGVINLLREAGLTVNPVMD